MKKSSKQKSGRHGASRPSAQKVPASKVILEEARLNVTLPVPLHNAVKIEAAKRRQTIRALIIELLEKEGITAAIE